MTERYDKINDSKQLGYMEINKTNRDRRDNGNYTAAQVKMARPQKH